MMKHDELMRGNFVLFFDKHKIGHKAIVDQVLRHSCLLLYTTEDAGEYGQEIIVNYEDIHPLQLTNDILEKNNFIKREKSRDITQTSFCFEQFIITKSFFDDSIFEIYAELDYNSVYVTKITYVHELQLFLKANKIEKEIKEI